MTDKLYSIQEVCAKWPHLPINRLRKAIKDGEIEFYDLSPVGALRKHRRFRQEDVERWIESLKNTNQESTRIIL